MFTKHKFWHLGISRFAHYRCGFQRDSHFPKRKLWFERHEVGFHVFSRRDRFIRVLTFIGNLDTLFHLSQILLSWVDACALVVRVVFIARIYFDLFVNILYLMFVRLSEYFLFDGATSGILQNLEGVLTEMIQLHFKYAITMEIDPLILLGDIHSLVGLSELFMQRLSVSQDVFYLIDHPLLRGSVKRL